MTASRVLTTAGQQPSSFHQAAIDRIQHRVEQTIDQPTQQAMRAAETAPLDQVLAEAAAGAKD